MSRTPTIVRQDDRHLERLRTEGLVWSAQGEHAVAKRSKAIEGEEKTRRLALFGIPEIDQRLPHSGLPSGCIHEWAMSNQLTTKQRGIWHPPLSLIASMLRASVTALPTTASHSLSTAGLLAWVGKRCWPSVHLLNKTFSNSSYCWEKNSLFIAPPNKRKHLWALLQALRSPAVFAVIGDASGLSGMASRKLQLAAEQGNSLGLLLRPPWELALSSSAYSKWHLQTIPSETESLLWNLELLRLRGSLNNTQAVNNIQAVNKIQAQHPVSSWPYTWEALEWDFTHGTISLRTAEAGISADTRQQQGSA